MERYERPDSSEISEHRHDSAERSPRSQMGDRERAEAGSERVPRRVVSNWERLVGAAVYTDLIAGNYYALTKIHAVMEAVVEIRNDNETVARILAEYAYSLTQQLDPSTEARGVLRFKSGVQSIILQRKDCEARQTDRSKDLQVITDYASELKEKEDIVNLDAEEQAAREGRAPEGENPEYQAWRTEKLRRFYEIFAILNNAAADIEPEIEPEVEETAELEVGSSSADKPLLRSYEEDDLLYLYRRLFYRLEDRGVYISYRDSKRTADNFSKLHDEILARDLKQFLDANTSTFFSKFVSRVFGGTTSSNEPSRGDLPMAEKLLNLCVEKVRKVDYTYSVVAHVMNRHQCHVLIERLQETRICLARIDQSQLLIVNPVLVLGELLQALHGAQILIEASCITSESQWPRAAFEQSDINHTLSRVLYELEWHTSVLRRMMAFGTSQYDRVQYQFLSKDGGKLSVDIETDLLKAMERDMEDLKHRLRSMKLADPTEQGLVDQLVYQMEALSSDLVFLNPDHFDHKGAGYIGHGAFGTVLETNFLGMECAMKVIKGGRGTEVDHEFEMETNAAQKLGNHPHLVRPYCYSKTNDACYLIMERMQMNLAEVLSLKDENGNGLSILEAVALMLQIGEGLKHIHSKGAAHRDLKPGNILVNLADPSRKKLSRIRSVKIADFGLTKTQAAIVTGSNHTRNTGTSVYMAPEVMKLGGDDPERTRFNPAKADVYSFAVVCSEILTGETPYQGFVPKQMKKQVKAGTLRPNLPTDCPDLLIALIKRCWAGDYAERPLLPKVCRELRYIKGLLLMYIDRVRHKDIR